MGILEKVFGDLNAKEVKKVEKIVDKIEALDEEMQALSDDELKAKTPEFKERLANGETLEEVGRRLGATREFVRQVEAKITRRFAMSQIGRKIRESLIALSTSGAAQSYEGLKACFGEQYAVIACLLRLYKTSPFYDGNWLDKLI
jgi:DNA polymerase/3'-5' exonuclease PolX